MIRLEQLPPDQRAVLSLLLRQRKRYEEVAKALGIAPEAVHDRAHAALAVLAPKQARLVDAGARERIGEYLLGQQDEQEASATKEYLAGSTPAREWARSIAVELVTLAAEAVPEIPPDAQAPAAAAIPAPVPVRAVADADGAGGEPPAARLEPTHETAISAASPVSRRGGAILLAGIVVIAAVVIAIVLSSGGGSGGGSGNQAASRTGEQTSTSGTHSNTAGQGKSKSSTGGGSQIKLEKLAELKPLSGGGSAKGYAAIVSKGTTHAVEIEANGLAPTEGFSYVVWLTGSHGETVPLGRVPSVDAKGHFRVIEALPVAPGSITGIEVSRETTEQPTSPGPLELKGSFVGA